MRLKKIFTIFVMALIVCIPVSFAISINVTSSAGNDGIEGVFDGFGDNWNIEVRAELDGSEVKPEYVTANFARSALPFDQCSIIADPYYSCSLSFPKDPSSFPENKLILPIILKHPVTGETAEAMPPAGIGVDAHLPITTIHSISQQGYDAAMDLEVRDGGSVVCSIDYLEFFDGNLLIDSLDLNVTDCGIWRNQSLIIPLTDVGTFMKTIRVVAYDSAGHAGDAVSDFFTLDHTPPVIHVDSFRFTELEQGQYIPRGSIQTGIAINITEEQTTPGIEEDLIVIADFSALGLSSAELADSCDLTSPASGSYTCTWNQKIIAIPESFTAAITAEDSGGIASTRAVSRGFLVDNTAPEVVYLGGNESMYVVIGNKNTLKAGFRETGSGINPDDISLDVRGIDPQASRDREADECIQQGDIWHCYWNNVRAEQAGAITLVQVKDAANNFALDLPTVLLNVDSDPPVIESIQILSLGGVQAGLVPYHEEGTYLQITAAVNDISGARAAADFRYATADADKVSADCQETETGRWTCVWSAAGPLITVAATVSRTIEFRFEDLVGNKADAITESIDIIDAGVDEPNPNYWSGSAAFPTAPEQLDRRLINKIQPYVFAPVELSPAVAAIPSNKWPLHITDVQCTSDYLSGPAEIFNYNDPLPPIGAQFPYIFYIKLNLAPIAPDDDNITIPCTFKVLSYVYGRALPNPEIENVNLTVAYYQNPLGEVAEEVQAAIEVIKTGWLVQQDWLDWAEGIINIGEAICKGMQILYNLNIIWAVIKDGFSHCCSNPYTAVACCPAEVSAGTAAVVQQNWIEEFYARHSDKCKILNCQYARESPGGADARNRWYQKWYDWAAETSGSHRGYFGNVRAEDSIILSVAFLCPKGVIYNLQKARQIDCRYAYCLEQTSSGVPVELCVQQRAFALCKYVFNQMFNLLPFAAVLSDIAESIGRALANPWVALELVGRNYCRILCRTPASPGCKVCSVIEFANFFAETLCDFGAGECEEFWETVDPIPNNYCEQIGIGD